MKMKKLYLLLINACLSFSGLQAEEPDYTQGLSIWFDTPNTLQGYAVWYNGRPDISRTQDELEVAGNTNTNQDPSWESKSLPIGNGNIGANIMGAVEAEALIQRREQIIIGTSTNSLPMF